MLLMVPVTEFRGNFGFPPRSVVQENGRWRNLPDAPNAMKRDLCLVGQAILDITQDGFAADEVRVSTVWEVRDSKGSPEQDHF